jgi:hypothetical protein
MLIKIHSIKLPEDTYLCAYDMVPFSSAMFLSGLPIISFCRQGAVTILTQPVEGLLLIGFKKGA